MASRKPEIHHGVPRCLLILHENAHGTESHGTELDGEGIQAWVEWEMEAMRLGVPIDISREKLEALVDRGTAGKGTCVERPSGPTQRTPLKPLETISKGEERA